jgi:molybdopterin-biosynthesis enzyme MoeA-like protein
LAIALAVIAGFVVMVMIGVVVLGGVWFLRASTYESQIQRQRTMADQQRELAEQLRQTTLDESQVLEDLNQLQRANEKAVKRWRAEMEVGEKLKAERPRIVDDVEIVEVLENGQVRIRWLSGQPGEEVLLLDRLRIEDQ